MEFEPKNWYINSKRGHGEYFMLGMVKFGVIFMILWL